MTLDSLCRAERACLVTANAHLGDFLKVLDADPGEWDHEDQVERVRRARNLLHGVLGGDPVTPRLIYIAGPYRGDGSRDAVKNIRDAIDAWHRLRQAGYVPFCPHAQTALMDLRQDLVPDDFLAYDMEWLRACDALVRLPGASRGADDEVVFAEALGLPVYHGLDQVPGVAP